MNQPKVAVLVPLYKRVAALHALSENLSVTTPSAKLFLRVCPVTPQFEVLPNMRIVESPTTRYGEGINLLAKVARDSGFEWLFIGADDLRFHEGWLEKALAHATPETMVIGTNDLGNARVMAGQHATHMLVRASYIEQGTIDCPGKLMSEAYFHSYVDDEIVATAKLRDCWAMALDSHVEHLHPLWGKGRVDETYLRGSGETTFQMDSEIFRHRKPLWEKASEKRAKVSA